MLKLLVLAASGLFAAGCALTNVDIHPPAASPPRAGDAGVGRGREIIVHAPFDDVRYELTRCGMKKNGYNTDTADVKCTVPPGAWLADALASELTRAGYKPLRSDAVPGPTTVVVHGTVHQLFLEPKINFWDATIEGDVSVRLVATSTSGLVAERAFFVKGTETTFTGTDDSFQTCADKATRTIARAMVAALTELLDHYPGLGAPSASAPATAKLEGSP